MPVVNTWCGATTPDSARVVARVTGSSARLAVDVDSGFTSPAFFGPVSPSADDVVHLEATGLDADTRYHFAVEVDDELDEAFRGQFRTHPPLGEPADFTFWAASCASGAENPGVGDVLASHRVSNSPVFDAIREQGLSAGWLFGFHAGDLHYYDLGSGSHGISGGGSLANYRRSYDDVLLQPRQHNLYRNLPVVYSWDDHDYGPNDSDATAPGRANAQQAYRERVPHYPLPDTEGIFHSFTVGRVLFVVADVRSDRDPNSSPQEPTKTMLGPAQKQWMADVMATTDAKFLVWMHPERRWHNLPVEDGSSNDSWGNYPHERDELADLFTQLGWSDRMICIMGDAHSMGLSSAANNPYGNFPVYQFAPLDSGPSSATPFYYDVGALGGVRGNYGVIRIQDTGDEIRITAQGWNLSTLHMEHTFTVEVDAPTAPPPPPTVPETPPQIARPRIRRRVTWHGVHAGTGRKIAELPDIKAGEIGRLLSAYHSSQLTLPIPLDGPAHVPIRLVEQATQPVNSALVAVVNDLPVWMGWVLARKGGTDADMQLATVTPEGYLRRRRVRDRSYSQLDRALIAAELLADAGPMPGVGAGLGFDLDLKLTGDLIDREYLASDRQSVYDALRELCADGLEFTIDLDWLDEDRTSVRKIVRIGPRIGQVQSDVVFETTASSLFEARAGSEATYGLTEDRSDGRYANWVQAYGPGEGEDQPASVPAIDHAALDAGAPIVEHHWQPSTTISDQQDLDRHASAELARLRRGAQLWEISARWDAYPRLGVDAQLGDDVSWLLHGHRHPDGVMGRGRMVGWRLDMQAGRWHPVLLDPQEA